jgi:hypothetical protein
VLVARDLDREARWHRRQHAVDHQDRVALADRLGGDDEVVILPAGDGDARARAFDRTWMFGTDCCRQWFGHARDGLVNAD